MPAAIKYMYDGVEYTTKKHPLYFTWRSMHNRTKCKTYKGFEAYTRKGIAVCERWDTLKAFVDDMGVKPKGFTLERVDNLRGYSPDNCIWASRDDQNVNKENTAMVTYEGKEIPLTTLARQLNLDRKVLYTRIVIYEWPLERALTQPVRKRSKSFK